MLEPKILDVNPDKMMCKCGYTNFIIFRMKSRTQTQYYRCTYCNRVDTRDTLHKQYLDHNIINNMYTTISSELKRISNKLIDIIDLNILIYIQTILNQMLELIQFITIYGYENEKQGNYTKCCNKEINTFLNQFKSKAYKIMNEKEKTFFKRKRITVISLYKSDKTYYILHYDNKYKISEFLINDIESIELSEREKEWISFSNQLYSII